MRSDPRTSASWYLGVLAAGVVLERYANYLLYEIPVAFGQATNIVLAFVIFGVAFAVWFMLPKRAHARSWLAVFLLLMGAAWIVHFVLYRYHGDGFNYTAFLYLPILALIWLKPPTHTEAWSAVTVFGWVASVVLVGTRLLESIGLLDARNQPDFLIEFDSERYFLPLNDLLGIDGRWPGPFGHNSDTAMIGALLVVIAVARWQRSSWVFLTVGAATLLLTNGRASVGAAVAGLVLMFMFWGGTVLRMTRLIRIPIGIVVLTAGAWFLVNRPAGLTGRNTIWPAFFELWQESPWIGVGSRGIAQGNQWTIEFGHAHNMYLNDLTREGLLGFGVQYVAIGLGVALAARAAWFGLPGPLAVIATYLITGITEPRNPWIMPSATGFLFILLVLVASTAPARFAAKSLPPRAVSESVT